MEISVFSVPPLWSLLLFTLLYAYFRLYHSRKLKLLNRFPGPKKLPVFGNSLELMTLSEVLKNKTKWERKCGPRYYMSFGAGQEFISLAERSDLEIYSDVVYLVTIVYRALQSLYHHFIYLKQYVRASARGALHLLFLRN